MPSACSDKRQAAKVQLVECFKRHNTGPSSKPFESVWAGEWPRGLALLVKTRQISTSWRHLLPEHVRRCRDSKFVVITTVLSLSPSVLWSPPSLLSTLLFFLVLFSFVLNPTLKSFHTIFSYFVLMFVILCIYNCLWTRYQHNIL